jgi:hypothetical protein
VSAILLSVLDMTSELGASTTGAAIALTGFWAMVTVGRVLFAAVDRVLPVRTTYHVLPFLLVGTFVVIACLPDGSTGAGIAAFGVGPLLDHGVGLSTVYGLAAVVAVLMGLASFGVTRATADEQATETTRGASPLPS